MSFDDWTRLLLWRQDKGGSHVVEAPGPSAPGFEEQTHRMQRPHPQTDSHPRARVHPLRLQAWLLVRTVVSVEEGRSECPLWALTRGPCHCWGEEPGSAVSARSVLLKNVHTSARPV